MSHLAVVAEENHRTMPLNRFLLTPYFLDRPEPRMHELARRDWIVNRPELPAGTVLRRIAALNEGIAGFAEQTIRQGQRPVSIAGDCCAAMGMIAGVQRAGIEAQLLWLDAHGDFNTPYTSPSGFIDGMALAMLVGRGESLILDCLGIRPLDEAAVVLCDARDLDPDERQAIASSRVNYLGAIERLEALDFGSKPVHLHLDADILDPQDAPGTRYPAAGGPRLVALQRTLQNLTARWRMVSVSLTTWDLDQDPEGVTEQAVWHMLHAALGDVSPPAEADSWSGA
jgi:arginase